MKVFIIHGWSYNLDRWTEFCGELKKLSLEPVQLRVPGLTEPSDKVWDISDYIGWLDNKIKAEKNPVVIGHSNGGRIALAYAQQNPHRLKQLILIDSAGIPHQGLRPNTKLKSLKIIAKVGKPLKAIPGVKQGFYKIIGASDYEQAPPNMRLTMQNMLAADKTINLANIHVPTTIIWGKEDKITPLSDGQKMAKAIKNSRLHIIDDARHAPFQTFPGKVAHIVNVALTG